MKNFFIISISLIVSLFFSNLLQAHEIHLKSGRIIAAEDVWEEDDKVICEKHGVIISFDKANVKEVKYVELDEAAVVEKNRVERIFDSLYRTRLLRKLMKEESEDIQKRGLAKKPIYPEKFRGYEKYRKKEIIDLIAKDYSDEKILSYFEDRRRANWAYWDGKRNQGYERLEFQLRLNDITRPQSTLNRDVMNKYTSPRSK